MKPIDQVERELRQQGIFLLVDLSGKKLWFYGYKRDQPTLNRLMNPLKGRSQEMGEYLIARTRAEGETT